MCLKNTNHHGNPKVELILHQCLHQGYQTEKLSLPLECDMVVIHSKQTSSVVHSILLPHTQSFEIRNFQIPNCQLK